MPEHKADPAGKSGKGSSPIRRTLREGRDFYFEPGGLMVFTSLYHRERGFCCKSGCRHCPYGFGPGLPEPQKEPS